MSLVANQPSKAKRVSRGVKKPPDDYTTTNEHNRATTPATTQANNNNNNYNNSDSDSDAIPYKQEGYEDTAEIIGTEEGNPG